jgi:hypothetical protein
LVQSFLLVGLFCALPLVVHGQRRPLPRPVDSVTYAIGGDTLLAATVRVFQAYAYRRAQVGPGADTTGPMRVEIVTVRYTIGGTTSKEPPRYAPCPMVLRLYRTPDRSGRPMWRSDAAVDKARCPASYLYGARVAVSWPVPAMLGDSLSPGKYFFQYSVRLADGTVAEYAAGGAYLTSDPRPQSRDWSSLRMRARTEIVGQAPRELVATAVITNIGSRTVGFEHGSCALRTLLYRPAPGDDRLIWQSDRRRDPRFQGGYACTLELLVRALPPGDSVVFSERIPLYEVLADTLADGRYHVVAELRLIDDTKDVRERTTVYRLEAGEVLLARLPDPLPTTRIVDGVKYSANTRLIRGNALGGGIVRTSVVITNIAGRRRDLELHSRQCPIRVQAYQSAEARDSAPMRDGVWRTPGSCAAVRSRLELAAGQTRTFTHDVRAADIADRAGRGRYYFTAWLATWPSVTLEAGTVEIAQR